MGQGLTPVASAYGLTELRLPNNIQPIVLESPSLVEGALSPLLDPLDLDKEAVIAISLDAEWNTSRIAGVSIVQIAPHSQPDKIYIIPVSLTFHTY